MIEKTFSDLDSCKKVEALRLFRDFSLELADANDLELIFRKHVLPYLDNLAGEEVNDYDAVLISFKLTDLCEDVADMIRTQLDLRLADVDDYFDELVLGNGLASHEAVRVIENVNLLRNHFHDFVEWSMNNYLRIELDEFLRYCDFLNRGDNKSYIPYPKKDKTN